MREAAAVNILDAGLTDGNGSKVDSEILLENVQRIAKQCFERARGSHDWEHTLRVFRLCRRIGSKEGADMDVLLAAAYLHDIGRGFQDASQGAVCHAQKGVEIAIPIVSALPLTEKQKGSPGHFSLPGK